MKRNISLYSSNIIYQLQVCNNSIVILVDFVLFFVATTIQSSQIGSVNDTSATSGTWVQCSCSYTATISKNLILQFTFRTNNKCTWYIDDVSVQDPMSTEMLTNGGFENSSLPIGWTTNPGSCSASNFGVSTSQPYGSTRVLVNTCRSLNHFLSLVVEFTYLYQFKWPSWSD